MHTTYVLQLYSCTYVRTYKQYMCERLKTRLARSTWRLSIPYARDIHGTHVLAGCLVEKSWQAVPFNITFRLLQFSVW